VAGSPFGIRGIATTPAPSLPLDVADFDDPLRVALLELSVHAAGWAMVWTLRDSAAGAVPQVSQ
jgi:hypothetical protein